MSGFSDVTLGAKGGCSWLVSGANNTQTVTVAWGGSRGTVPMQNPTRIVGYEMKL